MRARTRRRTGAAVPVRVPAPVRVPVPWHKVPRVVWELAAAHETRRTLSRLRRVCSQFRWLSAAWTELELDLDVDSTRQLGMCVGSRLLRVDLHNGSFGPADLATLARCAPNLESLSGVFEVSTLRPHSVLQGFRKLHSLSVSFQPKTITNESVIPALEALRHLEVRGSGGDAAAGLDAAATELLETLVDSDSEHQLESLAFDTTWNIQRLITHCGSVMNLKKISARFHEGYDWSPLFSRLRRSSLEGLELVVPFNWIIHERLAEEFPVINQDQLANVARLRHKMRVLLTKDKEKDGLLATIKFVEGCLRTEHDLVLLNAAQVEHASLRIANQAALSLCCRVKADHVSIWASHVILNPLITGAECRRLCLHNFDFRLGRGWRDCPLEEIHAPGSRITGRKPRHVKIEYD